MDNISVRTSDRLAFKKCRRQWDFSSDLRQGYKPVKQSEALDFGTAVHAGLEAWYNNFDQPFEVKYALMMKAFHDKNSEQYQDLKDNPHFIVDTETREEFDERATLGSGMLANYADYSLKNDKFKVLEVEKKFSIPLIPLYDTYDGKPIDEIDAWVYYEGKIDLIVEDDNGDVFVLDHKTASRFDYTDWLDVDTQISSYCWSLWALGYNVAGFIYNQIFKGYPQPPKVLKGGKLSKDKSQHTTYDLYCQALEENDLDFADYTEFLQYLKDNPKEYVRRKPVYRNHDELEHQRDLILAEIDDMIDDPKIYPNPNQFNCNFCKYFEPCLAIQEKGDPYDFLDNPELYTIEPAG